VRSWKAGRPRITKLGSRRSARCGYMPRRWPGGVLQDLRSRRIFATPWRRSPPSAATPATATARPRSAAAGASRRASRRVLAAPGHDLGSDRLEPVSHQPCALHGWPPPPRVATGRPSGQHGGPLHGAALAGVCSHAAVGRDFLFSPRPQHGGRAAPLPPPAAPHPWLSSFPALVAPAKDGSSPAALSRAVDHHPAGDSRLTVSTSTSTPACAGGWR